MRYPSAKHVRGSPDVGQAYVCPGTPSYPKGIRRMIIGVLSPAYHNTYGETAPRGIRMTLGQAEAFGRAIIRKVREAERWNREAELFYSPSDIGERSAKGRRRT